METRKKYILSMMLFMVATLQSVRAQGTCTAMTADDLYTAVKNNQTVTLGQDITLSSGRLDIDGTTVTLDLNGHTLTRPMTAADAGGQVIMVKNSGNLTIIDSGSGGKITGGWAYQGAGIYVYDGCSLTINGGTITGNRSDQIAEGGFGYGGGVENHGTMTITGGNITGNTAGQFGGGIHNEGTLTITGGTIANNTAGTYGGAIYSNSTVGISDATLSGNTAQSGGGAICSEGTLTIDGVTITGNQAQNGGGIYLFGTGTAQLKGESSITGNTAQTGGGIFMTADGATLKMQDKPVVKDNTTDNVHLQSYQLITVSGAFSEGARIGVSTEAEQSAFTAGYSTYNPGVAPSTYFFVSSAVIAGDVVLSGSEAGIQQTGYKYIDHTWNQSTKTLTTEEKSKTAGEYTVLGNNDGWTALTDNGWFVVDGEIAIGALAVSGTSNLILCDGAKVTVTEGVKVESKSNAVLNIYGQAGNSGQLIATNSHDGAAGIGSGGSSDDGDAGRINIHGGTITATGNKYAAGIGGGDKHGFGLQSNNSGLTVYGGTVTAQGGEFAAGIGSGDEPGKDRHAGYVVVYGGTVNATGGDEGAGIGGGNECHGALVNIYGGTVNATGGRLAAAIGGGDEGAGNQCNIHGGTVTASGGYAGAGIGGGEGGNGGYVNIYGGTVTATSEVEERNNQEPFPSLTFGGGAGIGGGTDGNSGNIVISGGNVTATGGGCYQTDNDAITRGAAGIGGGVSGGSGTITISGGNVSATSYLGGAGIGPGEHCGSKVGQCDIIISGGTVEANAIGEEPGAGIGYSHAYFGGKVKLTITGGTIFARSHYHLSNSFLQAYPCPDQYSIDDLTIPDGHKVRANINNVPKDEGGFYDKLADERKKVMTTYQSVWIEPCDHSGATYTVSGTTGNDTHTKHCNYCTTAFEAEKHTFRNGKCTVCGVGQSTYTITVNVPADNGANDGVYEAVTYQMVPGTTFKLPASPITFSDRVFAGWLVGTVPNNSYTTRYGEELLAAGEKYTINDDVTFTARYSYVYITLADNADNSETLAKYAGKTAIQVLLRDRALYKDGSWNTLCLPFALSDFTGTPLEGATVKTLESSAFNETDGTLTLSFSDASKIEAGKPYLVKWTAQNPNTVESPVFNDVTISKTTTDVETDEVTFKGIFSPYAISGEDKTMLYLDTDNKLCYPNTAMTIGSCRAYFQLADGLTAGESASAGAKSISHIVLNFGDGVATGVTNTDFTDDTDKADIWYSLDGRRLSIRPTAKGIYIYQGRKVIIK